MRATVAKELRENPRMARIDACVREEKSVFWWILVLKKCGFFLTMTPPVMAVLSPNLKGTSVQLVKVIFMVVVSLYLFEMFCLKPIRVLHDASSEAKAPGSQTGCGTNSPSISAHL